MYEGPVLRRCALTIETATCTPTCAQGFDTPCEALRCAVSSGKVNVSGLLDGSAGQCTFDAATPWP